MADWEQVILSSWAPASLFLNWGIWIRWFLSSHQLYNSLIFENYLHFHLFIPIIKLHSFICYCHLHFFLSSFPSKWMCWFGNRTCLLKSHQEFVHINLCWSRGIERLSFPTKCRWLGIHFEQSYFEENRTCPCYHYQGYEPGHQNQPARTSGFSLKKHFKPLGSEVERGGYRGGPQLHFNLQVVEVCI